MKLKKGEKAPDFVLKDTNLEDVTLDELISDGNLLLLFFPLAFSGVCTDEMCTTRDNLKLYNAFKTNVVGVSVDSMFALKAFKKSNNLNFTLISDFNKELSRSFGVLNESFFGMKGVSKRAAFLIDTDKKIIYSEVLEDSDQQPDFKKIQQLLRR